MQLETFQHRVGAGWSQPLPSHLDSANTAILVFGSPAYVDDGAPFAALQQAFPQALMVGCSTAGEVFGDTLQDDSLSVAVVRFEHTRVARAFTTIDARDDSFNAGRRLAEQLAAPDLRAVFVLSDGIVVNGTGLVQGMNASLPESVRISGGLAGDGQRFERTWVLDGAERRSGCVCALGLYGDAIRVGLGSRGGWSDFGHERHITRAQGPVLYALDDKPALDLYKDYLGKLADGLPGAALRFPLSVRDHASDSESVVRTILAVDEAEKALVFAGDIPQGGIARLMRTNPQGLIDSAAAAAHQAAETDSALAPGQAALVVSVSCVGRRIVLGEQVEEEIESVMSRFPQQAGHVGFYSYGEISPAGGCTSRLHNQTMTVTVLSEAAV